MGYSEKVLRICRAAGPDWANTPLFRAGIGLLFASATALCSAPVAHAQSSQRAGGGALVQHMLIPLPDLGISMHTSILRPPGAGPFPLVLINHASTENAELRANLPAPRYATLAEWFRKRGYLVALPQRPGHGVTAGPYLEDQGGCEDADYVRAGRAGAAIVDRALAALLGRPDVRKTDALVVGHSAGGWSALALASRNPRGVTAIINFAGGRGGRSYDHANNNCAPDRLIDAARQFGATARIPTLWIYVENDSYFAPWLARRMAEAWRAGGGRVDLVVLPVFGLEGHRLAEADDGEAAWASALTQFLAQIKPETR
jgi:dienelactone hydrolase